MHRKRTEPLYLQIVGRMRENISGQHWKPGTLLPTEFELAKQYGVSRPTLRNAMALLENEGYIVRRKFSGTMVAPDALRRKYEKLDLGFVSKMDLQDVNAYSQWLQEPYQFGTVLRNAVTKGYFVRFIPWRFNVENNYYDLEELMFKKAIDAFIVSSPLYARDFLDGLADNRIPHVALESHYDRPGVNTVMLDDRSAAAEAVQILYDAGHRKIGLMAGALKAPEFCSQNRRVLDSVLETCARLGLKMQSHWIMSYGEKEWRNLPQDESDMARGMLENPKTRPTAVICATEKTVDYVLRYCREAGIRVPEDLSLICEGHYLSPVKPVCSCHVSNLDTVSEAVYEELLTWLKTPKYKPGLRLVSKTFTNLLTVSKPSQGGK
jgi:DNA-binding LacI/PurR family transcriptional regulator/DNA-binding transcriptional regulator YhcF (GntR family)